MVAPMSTINFLPPWKEENNIQINKETKYTHYSWYKKEYDEFHKENPKLQYKVSVNDPEIMEESLKQGLLYFVQFNNERIGVISPTNMLRFFLF